MNQLDGLRRYLEAATTLTQITRGRAEELVRELVMSGELERTRAQEWIEDLLKRSREASEILVASISAEVDRQLADRGLKNIDLDDLAQKVAGILEHAGTVGRTVTVPRVWSRGPGSAGAPAAAPHKADTATKAKSGSGKKKDGSPKSSSKQGKKGPESKKVPSKKPKPDHSQSERFEPEKAEAETQLTQTPPAEIHLTQTQPAEAQSPQTQQTETQFSQTQPSQTQPSQTPPAETQAAETQASETQPVDHGVAT